MDLNELYSRHQIALINATHAGTTRTRDLAAALARHYAGRIDKRRAGLACAPARALAA